MLRTIAIVGVALAVTAASFLSQRDGGPDTRAVTPDRVADAVVGDAVAPGSADAADSTPPPIASFAQQLDAAEGDAEAVLEWDGGLAAATAVDIMVNEFPLLLQTLRTAGVGQYNYSLYQAKFSTVLAQHGGLVTLVALECGSRFCAAEVDGYDHDVLQDVVAEISTSPDGPQLYSLVTIANDSPYRAGEPSAPSRRLVFSVDPEFRDIRIPGNQAAFPPGTSMSSNGGALTAGP